jgi:hypothetical protein
MLADLVSIPGRDFHPHHHALTKSKAHIEGACHEDKADSLFHFSTEVKNT